MKNKRVYAIVLLIALAMLQVRVAFAGCLAGPQVASASGAACCDEGDMPQDMSNAPDAQALMCAEHCLKPYAAKDADSPVAGGLQVSGPAGPLGVEPKVYLPLDVRAQFAVSDAHPPHTRLIYVLQRLLI